MNEVKCSDCNEIYEDTLDGLIEHIFQSNAHDKAMEDKWKDKA